jgi:hypothetical protein
MEGALLLAALFNAANDDADLDPRSWMDTATQETA